jgi:transcriptional regulator with XRE-family HTH domain
MTHTDEHAPHPLDVALGLRIRSRRKELGLSQDQLAREIGITFQQIQKYEHGANRVSFSRLAEIAEALDCGVMDIVGDLDKSKTSTLLSKQIALLSEAGAGELLEAYCVIHSAKRRKAILNLARQMADDQGGEGQAARDANEPSPHESSN